MTTPSAKLEVSIIVPVYKGSEYLAGLVDEIERLRSRWIDASLTLNIAEAIFVMDSPVDNSRQLLDSLSARRTWVRSVDLSRNYGQHSATVAGILFSSGDWIVTLDEDLQHHPSQIETLLGQILPFGMDVIYASSPQAVHGSHYRDSASKLVKFIVGKISANRFVSSFNSFRLIRGDVARAAASICAQHTYFDIALTWFTDRIKSVEVSMTDRRNRSGKKSGYRFSTLVNHAKKLILTSDFRILRATTSISILAFAASLICAGWVFYRRFLAENPVSVEGWASLMILILAFGSISVFMLGLIAEFLHTNMLQLQGKPTFFVVDRSSDSVLSGELEKLDR